MLDQAGPGGTLVGTAGLLPPCGRRLARTRVWRLEPDTQYPSQSRRRASSSGRPERWWSALVLTTGPTRRRPHRRPLLPHERCAMSIALQRPPETKQDW